MTAITEPAAPPDAIPGTVEWMVPPGTDVAHAYGPAGWARSVCREVVWSILLVLPEPSDTRCQSCLVLLGFGE